MAKDYAPAMRPVPSTFQIGDAFPQNDPRSAVAVLFVMASHKVMAKARAASRDSEACDQEERLALLEMIGPAKEAMDAFRVADSLGCFKTARNTEKALELARHESDAAARGSLYQIVQRVRNQAAYHWDCDRIQAALTELQGGVLPLNAESSDATMPLIGAITSKILERFGINEPGIFPRLTELAEALGQLGLVLYACHTQAHVRNPHPEPTRPMGRPRTARPTVKAATEPGLDAI